MAKVNEFNYAVINYKKFLHDVKASCNERNESIRDLLIRRCGISENTINNSADNAKRNMNLCAKYDYCEKYGVMQKVYLKSICENAGLNEDDYICKKKQVNNAQDVQTQTQTQTQTQESNSNSEIIGKIDELIMAVNKLGNIQMQNMEYLKEIKDGIDKLNDKWK